MGNLEYLENKRLECLSKIDAVQDGMITAFWKDEKLKALKDECSIISNIILELKSIKKCACKSITEQD